MLILLRPLGHNWGCLAPVFPLRRIPFVLPIVDSNIVECVVSEKELKIR